MKIIIFMDSGREYVIEHEDLSIDNLIGQFKNEMGIMKNTFMQLSGEKFFINPSHISSIEVQE